MQVKLCQKWVLYRTTLGPLACSSHTCLLHLSHLLTWSCDSISSPQINPSLLLRVIEVFLDPPTYSPDHAPSVIARLYTHLVDHHFFRSILTLLQLKVPPPDDPDATPTPLAVSLLDYLTRPLQALETVPEGGRRIYESLANEILSLANSPHVSYYVLPRLRNSHLSMSALVRAVTAGLSSGGVAPSVELLYGVIQLTHFTNTVHTDPQLLQDYLHLLSLLLGHAPSSHVTTEEGEEEEEEEEMSVDLDPVSSPESMLRHCLATIGGDQLLTCLQQRRYGSVVAIIGE